MLRRLIISFILLLSCYVACQRFGLKGFDFALYSFISYLSFEFMLKRFRSPLMALSTFFALKFLKSNFPIELNDLELLIFLLSISTVWIDFGQPHLSLIGLSISAFTGFMLFSAYPVIRIAVLILTAILASTVILQDRFPSVLEWRGFLLATSLILIIYFAFLREMLSDRPGLLSLLDWVIVLGILLKAVRKVRLEVVDEEFVERHKRFEGWTDEVESEVRVAKDMFVERGNKVFLTVVLSKYLSNLKTGDVARVVYPLFLHEDRKVPKLAFNWEKRRIEEFNRMRRVEVLKEVLRRLREVVR